jgi:dTDP-glucose 4,6-dehydratase
MKKIIVTGGLGFIGSNLINLLLRKKYFVINIDKVSYSSNFKNINAENYIKKYKLYKINIKNSKKIKEVLIKHKPDAIFNLAAETHVDRSIDSPKNFIDSNIVGVFNLLECVRWYLRLYQKKTFKFIHVSTDEVFGDIREGKFSLETDAFMPSSPYASTKASSDLLIKSYVRTYKLPAIITNCSNNYGPRQNPEKLIPKIILNLINEKDIHLYGNGKNKREWIFVKDHCEALLKTLKKGKIGNSYNIGGNQILTNLKIAELILKKIKSLLNISSKIKFVRDRPGHDKRYALNSNKFQKATNWKPRYYIHDGLEITINWYLKNKNWIKGVRNEHFSKRLGLKN